MTKKAMSLDISLLIYYNVKSILRRFSDFFKKNVQNYKMKRSSKLWLRPIFTSLTFLQNNIHRNKFRRGN